MTLPPNQQLAAPGKWPVVGERAPRRSEAPWTLTVAGLVETPWTWTLEELRALPRASCSVDIHCVTRWSRLGVTMEGVALRELLHRVGAQAEARFVSFVARSERNHSSSLTLEDALSLGTLLVWAADGKPLSEEHGGPLRIVTPGRYFYKSVKWVERIELLAEDRLGYWEAQAGYHNVADPWREQRFLAANLDRQLVRQLLQRRDFSGRDLRGLEAGGMELAGLNATGALIRDGHFEKANLQGACFDGANLSGAHFQGADLRGATFRGLPGQPADLEGADFREADLRGAEFAGASLFGCSFCDDSPCKNDNQTADSARNREARIDHSTRIDEASLLTLASLPNQFAFVSQAIRNLE